MAVSSRRRVVALVVGLAFLGAWTESSADPEPCGEPCDIHITVPTTIDDGAGHNLSLPPGYFLDEPTWTALDTRVKTAEDQVTRLSAENESLRKSASAWTPGWKVLVGALVVGFAGGTYVAYKYF